MESSLTVGASVSFLLFLISRARGIIEGLGVPFLLWMGMHFSLVFLLLIFLIWIRSVIFIVAAIIHSKCMRFWRFDFPHSNEFILLKGKGLHEIFERRHNVGFTCCEPYWMKCRHKDEVFWFELWHNRENLATLLLGFVNSTTLELQQ